MKKLLSMLLVVAMIASMSLVAFAVDGVTVEVVETDAGITVTYYVSNPTNLSGFTAALAFPADKVSTDKSFTLASGFEVCEVTPSSKSGNVKYVAAITSASNYITKSGKVAMISFPLTRVDADAVLTSADFAYGTGMYVSKIVEGTTQYKSGTDAFFTAPVYRDDRTPVGGGDEGGDDPVVEPSEDDWKSDASWDSAGFTYNEQAYTGKKIVAFGKNATGAKLEASSYGIKIGANSYPGLMDVEADQSFAIVLIDTNNDAKISGTYTYSIWVGTEDTTKVGGLSPVVENAQ